MNQLGFNPSGGTAAKAFPTFKAWTARFKAERPSRAPVSRLAQRTDSMANSVLGTFAPPA